MTRSFLFLLLLPACGSDPDPTSPPPNDTEETSDTSGTTVTWDGPLRPIDGVCVGQAPAPICEPRHLGTPKALDDPRTCDTRSDCLPNEFCGAGTCRMLEGEQGTLCFERAWVEGAVCDDVEQLIVKATGGVNGTPGPAVILESAAPLDLAESCRSDAPVCARVDLGSLPQEEFTATVFLETGGELAGYGGRTFMLGTEFWRALIDTGCHPVGGQAPAGGQVELRAHMALWYP